MDTRTRGWLVRDGQLARGTTRWLTERAFRRADIPAVRQFARAFGLRAGIAPARLADFVLAVSEAAACATAAGAGTARVRLWVAGTRAFCQVRGGGIMRWSAPSAQEPGSAGEVRPSPRTGGAGRLPSATEEEALRRWVLRRLTDHASVAYEPDGVCVLLSMRVA